MSNGTRTRGLQSHSLESASEILGENEASAERANTGANSGASADGVPAGGTDPELAAVVSAWGALPAALRAGIVAMVRAARSEA